jgi:hypothetical protein
VSVTCLLDTGAAVTVISENIFKKICDASHRVPLVKSHTDLYSVSGNKIPIRGKAILHFGAIKQNLPVLVLPTGVIQQQMIS